MKHQMINSAIRILKALANENRLKVLYLIKNDELSVGNIEKNLKLSQSALSQHLAVLRNYQIVETRRQSQTIFYRLKDNKTREIIDFLDKIF